MEKTCLSACICFYKIAYRMKTYVLKAISRFQFCPKFSCFKAKLITMLPMGTLLEIINRKLRIPYKISSLIVKLI